MSYANASIVVTEFPGPSYSDDAYFLSSSISSTRKHTNTSSVGDVHSDTVSLMFLRPKLPLSSSRTWDYFPLPTPPLWSPIPQDCHRDTAASVIVPESSMPQSFSPIIRTRRLFLVLCRIPLLLWLSLCKRLTLSTTPLFSSYSFPPRSLQEILSVLQSCRKYFCTKCTLTLCMYPVCTGD